MIITTRFAGINPAGAVWLGGPQEESNMNDMIVDETRRVREELIDRYGGIDKYFKHCQAQDRARTARAKSRLRKRPTLGRKSAKSR